MKIAIVSDIHGNLTALESVLPAISDADRVICLGDVAAVGPRPRETIAFLRWQKWSCVLGNTDEMLADSKSEDYHRLKIPQEERRKMVALDRWTATQLDASDRRFLSGFKPTIKVRLGHNSLLCYHGSPRSNTEGIISTTPDERLTKILGGQRASVYAGGHTHAQMVRKFGATAIINPGSVGLPFFIGVDGRHRNPTWAEYAILTASANDLRVELRRAGYSSRALKDSVRRSGMPDPDWWMADWL